MTVYDWMMLTASGDDLSQKSPSLPVPSMPVLGLRAEAVRIAVKRRQCRRIAQVAVVATLTSLYADLHAQTISTFAGGGTGDGRPATSASLFSPYGVAVDAAGNVLIADNAAHTIRKVSGNGTLTTVVGNGAQGYSGDGGPAVSAALNYPSGLTVDASGNLYIADSHNNRIRKVDPNGTIVTVAGWIGSGYSGDGGPAAYAQLNSPSGVAIGSNGNLFIADINNNVVRKVDALGTITTIAGNGGHGFSGDGGPAKSAQLSSPSGVAVDTAGNLYIADNGNNRIRKVGLDGTIHTVAGNGSFGYAGDGQAAVNAELEHPFGVAVDAGGALYIADSDSCRIRKVDSAGVITTVAGNGTGGNSGDGGPATNAQLAEPVGIAVDAVGNLYIAASYGSVVRKVTTNGIIVTVAGNGRYSYSGDGGPATSAQLNQASGVAADAAGNTYFADFTYSVIRKIDSSGKITTIAGNGTQGYSGDGGAAINAQLWWPTGVAVDASRNLYISDFGNNVIRKITPGGIITTVAGGGSDGGPIDGSPALGAQFWSLTGVAVDRAQNLYFASSWSRKVYKVTSGGAIATLAGGGSPGAGYGDGGLATNAELHNPIGVAVDSQSNVYVADSDRIREIHADGLITTFAGGGDVSSDPTFNACGVPLYPVNAEFWHPMGVAVDAWNNVYVTDSGRNCVVKIDAGGAMTGFAGYGGAGYSGDGGAAATAKLDFGSGDFAQIIGVAVGTGGHMYVADWRNKRIRKIALDELFRDGFD